MKDNKMQYNEKLDIKGHDGLVLNIKAYKHGRGKIGVVASIARTSGGVLYYKRLRTIECERITSKALQDALDSTLSQLDYIREKALEHYQSCVRITAPQL
jgi:hypothetical protein